MPSSWPADERRPQTSRPPHEASTLTEAWLAIVRAVRPEADMINVAILYPNIDGARFDAAYYLERHMPMSIELLRSHPGYRGVSVEIAIGGVVAGSSAAYIAMCHYRFASVDDFVQAFTPHQDRLQDDIAVYTDIEPVIQFNEIAIAA